MDFGALLLEGQEKSSGSSTVEEPEGPHRSVCLKVPNGTVFG